MRVLMLVDGDPGQLRLVSALAQRAGWKTLTAAGPDMALARLASRDGASLDAILIDGGAGDVTGLIAAMRSRRRNVPIVLLTTSSSAQLAVAAMRAGASDYLVKPIAPERLLAALDGAVQQGVDGGELRSLAEKIPADFGFDGIVGTSINFRNAIAIAAKAARATVPLLIEGEAGVGKDLLARAVHQASDRAAAPLVVVHCAALPANAVQSYLFGHEAGAFTGAFSRQVGKLVEAAGSTILLDQVDALPADAQAKLLDYIVTGRVHPIGGEPVTVDARVLAASDVPLLDLVEAGHFREDLYYRLATVHVTIPPLRERTSDFPALVEHLLDRIARQPGLRRLPIERDAVALLQGYDWPGNVRQLQAVLFRAAVLCDDDELCAAHFPHVASRRLSATPTPRDFADAPGVNLFESDGNLRTLDAIEADIIRFAVSHYRGRMTEVARRLGIGRSTLYRKLTELGISDAA